MQIQIGEITIDIETPCEFRAEIYRRYLENVARGLHHQAALGFAALPNHDRIRTALADRNLLVALAKILDEYVIVGVAADMKKWRTVAYNDDPPIPPMDFPNVPIDVDFLMGGRELAPPGPPQAPIAQAYQDYFRLYITRPGGILLVNQNGEAISGIDAFFRRYPMIAHAVTRSATNFLENIRLACQHILDDWDLIENIFFPDRLLYRLTKITSTGSDSHKGGKQVLILTFTVGQEPGHKLVYKPSDIEIDYRLVGNTENIRNNDAIYHLSDQQSLIELINSCFPDNAIKLPTYRILPKNPGSGLVEANGILPIQNSYGYIEFLTHLPDNETNGTPINWDRKLPSDWVTSDLKDVKRLYYQWGCLLAIATIFSLSDMHKENTIVQNLQPHLIDLENSFTGPMMRVQDTQLIGNILTMMPLASTIIQRRRTNDLTTNLVVDDVLLDNQAGLHTITSNKLWFSQRGGNPAETNPRLYFNKFYEGFIKTMVAMRNNGVIFRNWLNHASTQNTIARFIANRTENFATQLRRLYSPTYCSLPSPTEPGNTFNREPFNGWQTNAINAFAWQEGGVFPEGETRGWPNPRPNYAIQTPQHSFSDYLNCDIPAYYHRINSPDLLNARGERVAIPGQNPIQGNNVVFPNNPIRDTYFPESTFTIVLNQLNNLIDNPIRNSMTDFTNELRNAFQTPAGRIKGLFNWLI